MGRHRLTVAFQCGMRSGAEDDHAGLEEACNQPAKLTEITAAIAEDFRRLLFTGLHDNKGTIVGRDQLWA